VQNEPLQKVWQYGGWTEVQSTVLQIQPVVQAG